MNNYSVFEGLSSDDILHISECLRFEERSFRKGSIIMKLSENSDYSGIIRSGTAYLKSIGEQGEENILDIYFSGNIFSGISSTESNENLYYVFAKTDCAVSIFPTTGITGLCSRVCSCHKKFADNVLISTVYRSRIHLDILSGRTIRRKFLSLFEYFAQSESGGTFSLPAPLCDLAEYICVDRSAMMRELAKMKREKIISCPNSDRFILNTPLSSCCQD